MKILFMGTPDFAKESLENLYNKFRIILKILYWFLKFRQAANPPK